MPKTKNEFLEMKKSIIVYLEYAKRQRKYLENFIMGYKKLENVKIL
jgi:hypothetical protein